MKELRERLGRDAAKYFAFIKSRFPFSHYAVLAELRLADADLGAGQYVEAVDGYKQFIKFHPTARDGGERLRRSGSARPTPSRCPSDFGAPAVATRRTSRRPRTRATSSRSSSTSTRTRPYRDKAKEILVKVGKRLADHEWYVARYYWQRDKPMGTVLRLRRLLERYRGVGYDDEALWLLGRAYVAGRHARPRPHDLAGAGREVPEERSRRRRRVARSPACRRALTADVPWVPMSVTAWSN